MHLDLTVNRNLDAASQQVVRGASAPSFDTNECRGVWRRREKMLSVDGFGGLF